jgi:hypothetical protein
MPESVLKDVAVTGSPCPPAAGTLFRASYAGENYDFVDGDRRRFGRDDDACEIPIWEEIRRVALSKVAGVLWCMDGELWVRNLSGAHELAVTAGSTEFLPVCAPGELGAARSVPTPSATISAPTTGSWSISIVRIAEPGRRLPAARPGADAKDLTVRIHRAPGGLQQVAVALCAPMLADDRNPATYDQVALALGLTKRQARRRVEELCTYYRTEYPSLLSGDPRSGEPVYAELARLLVRRGAVTREDLAPEGRAR